jgi:hypothetical protein
MHVLPEHRNATSARKTRFTNINNLEEQRRPAATSGKRLSPAEKA